MNPGSLWEQFRRLPLAAQVGLLSVVGILGLVFSLTVFKGEAPTNMSVLYDNLTMEDAGAMAAKLEELGIATEVQPDGKIIRVPHDQVAKARLELANEGLPKGGGVGFEIFDSGGFGTSSFVQQTNYKRALQGELARTIASLEEVESARVHIVLPKRALLADSKESARASVALKLERGRRLNEKQIGGIIHMIASAVDGLSARDVTLIDQNGNLLAGGSAEQDDVAAGQLDIRTKFETQLQNDVESLVGKVLGTGNVVARVSAEFDFSATQKTEERFDPEGRVARREMRSTAQDTRSKNANGIAGAAATQTAAAAPPPPNSQQSQKENTTTEYELSKTVSTTVGPRAQLVRQSVAVLVNSKIVHEDGTETEFTDERRTQLLDLVQRAIGFDAARGDQVTLTAVPFAGFESGVGTEAAAQKAIIPTLWQEYGPTALLSIALYLLGYAFLQVRRVRKLGAAAILANQGAAVALPAGEHSATPALTSGRNPLRQMASDQPEQVAQALRSWLNG